jgi:putative DNA methylase
VRPAKGEPRVELEVFTPKTEKDVRRGTVSRAKASCVCCNTVLAPERVRAQLAAHRGGADVVFDAKGSRTGGATLLAVVTLREAQAGRQYRLPTAADCAAVWKAQQRLKEVAATKPTDGLSAIPDEPLPPVGTLGFRVQRYGMTQWGRPVHCAAEARNATVLPLVEWPTQSRSITDCYLDFSPGKWIFVTLSI